VIWGKGREKKGTIVDATAEQKLRQPVIGVEAERGGKARENLEEPSS